MDDQLRAAERLVAVNPGDGRALLALWKEQRRSGVPSPFVFDFQHQPGDAENYSGWSVRPARPGSAPVEWDGRTGVAYVYRRGESHELWTYHNACWLVGLKDGRFALVSQLSSGTCSYCASASDDAVIGDTLEDVIVFGMGDTERRLAGLGSVAP